MFDIEVKFKVGGREVPPERFMALFFRECLGDTLNEVMTQLKSATVPVQPLAAPAPVAIPTEERRVVSVREAAQLLKSVQTRFERGPASAGFPSYI